MNRWTCCQWRERNNPQKTTFCVIWNYSTPHPGKLTWNLKKRGWKDDVPFRCFFFERLHVTFQGSYFFLLLSFVKLQLLLVHVAELISCARLQGMSRADKKAIFNEIGSHVNIWSLGWHIIETLHPQVFMRIMALDVNLPTNPIRRDDPRFYIKNGSFFRIRIASTCHHLFPTILVRELENIVHPNHHPKHGPYLR